MRVIIVDDNTTNLAVLCSVVGKIPNVEVEGFAEPRAALENVAHQPVDLIVVDYVMPEMNGIEFLTHARAVPGLATTPMIMLTADSEQKLKQDAMSAGASDFLNKPVNLLDLRARVTNLLALTAAQRKLSSAPNVAEENVAPGNMVAARLSRVIENMAGGHASAGSKAAEIGRIIAEEMGLDAAFCANIGEAVALRDIGMVTVPSEITSRRGPLTDSERNMLRAHAEAGAKIIGDGGAEPLQMAHDVALGHHERWDGAGYPRQLSGVQIPLAARIAAVADAFCAITTPRSYRPAADAATAREEILRCNGAQFDPACVAAFEKGWPRIQAAQTSPRLETAA